MNNKYIFAALAAGAVMLTSCSDELISEQKVIKQTGDEIMFGGRARFEQSQADNNAKTRTIYTGKTYTENGKTYEGVQWQKNDKVRIYCPQSAYPSNHISDYIVSTEAEGVTSNPDSLAGLTRIDPNGALQWGNTNEAHDFYAVYPSPEQYSNGTEVFTGDTPTKITGVIPGVQVHKGITSTYEINNSDFKDSGDSYVPEKGTLHVVNPNMDYAYMVARTRVSNPNNMGEGVVLQFTPIATAVEITLRNLAYDQQSADRQDIRLNSVVVSTRGDNAKTIFGGFTTDLSTIGLGTANANGVSYGTGYPTGLVVDQNVASGTQISLPMLKNGTSGEALDLKYGDAVKFTVFLLPTEDIDNLDITFNGIQGSHTGQISGVVVQKHKKTILKNVPITGKVLPFNYKNWLRWISDDAIVRELSIPGAGGAATYALQQSDITASKLDVTAGFIQQQTKSIGDQWNAGIRCFEFSVDLETDGKNNLGYSKVICSGVPMTNMTLAKAVNIVQDSLLKYPNEFAMCIITYETSGGWSGERNPAIFQAQLNNFWNDVKAGNTVDDYDFTWTSEAASNFKITPGTALYDPSTATVGESRGKMFCISRPTSIHQDYGDDVIDLSLLGNCEGTSENTYYRSSDATYTNGNVSKEVMYAHAINKDISKTHPDMASHDHILVIHGWGPLKDKWQQRGFTKYSIRRTQCNNSDYWENFNTSQKPSSYNDTLSIGKWLRTYTTLSGNQTIKGQNSREYTAWGNKDGKPGRPFDTSKYSTSYNSYGQVTLNGKTYYGTAIDGDLYAIDIDVLSPDYTYETSKGKAWIQEWARVSNSEDMYQLEGYNGGVRGVYWAPSKAEKFKAFKDAFNYAVNKKVVANGATIDASNYVFINSLCGYYTTTQYMSSVYPCSYTDVGLNWFWGTNGELFSLSVSSTTAGMGGDIENFAKDINDEAYNYLLGLTQGETYSPGSLGIVLMDRVGVDKGAEIPGVIIGNNFMFELNQETNPTMVVSEQTSESNSLSKVRNGLSAEGYNMKWE